MNTPLDVKPTWRSWEQLLTIGCLVHEKNTVIWNVGLVSDASFAATNLLLYVVNFYSGLSFQE